MKLNQFTFAAISFAVLTALSIGCSQPEVTVSENSESQTATATTEASSSVEPLTSGNAYRRELTRVAMLGLKYDSGRVVVDQKNAALATKGIANRDALSSFGSGNDLLERGRIIDAIKAFTHCVISEPENTDYLDGLGRVMLAKRKYDKAEAAFRTALDIDPTRVDSRFQLAFAVSARGNLDESMSLLNQVVDAKPDHALAHSRLAIGYYYQNKFALAEDHIAQAEALDYEVPPQLKTLLEGGFPRLASPAAGGATQVGQQRRVDLSNIDSGNETTCSAHENFVVAGWNDYRTPVRCGISLSVDNGTNWADFIFRPPVNNQTSAEGDPMTCYDARTGDLWIGAIAFGGNGGMYVARKDAGSSTFEPSLMAEVSGGADKGWMAAGVAPNNPNATRVYMGYNEGLLVSADRGDTWTGPIALPEFGLGWCPRVGPAGELYMSYWDTDDGVKLIRSLDGGNTIEGPITIATRMDVWGIDGTRFPGRFRATPLNVMAVDPVSGDLYVTYFDTTEIIGNNRNVDIYFCRSTDQGLTWSTPVVINDDNTPHGDQFFPWMEVDETGRINMVFNDTRSVAQNDNAGANALIEVYYSYSDDGGASWNELVLTDQPFNSLDDGFSGTFIGDYLGMGVFERNVYPCYMSTHEGTANVYVHEIVNTLAGGYGPDSFSVVRGVLQNGGVTELTETDDVTLGIQPGFVLNNTESPIRIEFVGTSTGSPSQLSFLAETRSTTPNIEQQIEVFNYANGNYELLDTRNASFNVDSVTEVAISGTVADYVQSGTGETNSQVSWRPTGFVILFPWTIEIDQIQWSE